MITKKAQEFISDNSSGIGLLLKASDFLDVYHVDDDFETKGHEKEYVVGTPARYKYLIKKRKGSSIPPRIDLPELELLAESLLEGDTQPLAPEVEKEEVPEETPDITPEDDDDIFSALDIKENITEEEVKPPVIHEDVTPSSAPNLFDMSTRPFVANRVVIVPIERKTSARVTDYLFHNNKLLSGEELRGVVDAYFQS